MFHTSPKPTSESASHHLTLEIQYSMLLCCRAFSIAVAR
jgi:hypothetical protein